MKKTSITHELLYIEHHYQFSDDVTPELKEYLLENYLVDYDRDSDLVFITPEAELYLGNTKQDLRDKYDETDEDLESYGESSIEQEYGDEQNDF